MANPFIPRDVRRMEHAHTCHTITVDPDFDPDEALQPRMWTLCVERCNMQAGDEIRVMPGDVSWVLRLVVVFRKGTVCHVAKESFARLEMPEANQKASDEMHDRHEAKFNGPHDRWCVIDTKTGDKLFKQLKTKEEAEEEIRKLMVPA